MPAVFGVSVSLNSVPYSELWLVCIADQLKAAMKHAFDGDGYLNVISDIDNLKKRIPIFKKSGLNDKMHPSKELKQ